MDISNKITEHVSSEFMHLRPDLTLAHDLPLVENGLIDSFGLVQLVEFLEEAFSIEIKTEDVTPMNFFSVDTISSLVQRYVDQGTAA